AAIDSKSPKSGDKKTQGRFDDKLVARAVELRTKEHLGIVNLVKKLHEEGFRNTKGGELLPQSVRARLIAVGAWDARPKNAEAKKPTKTELAKATAKRRAGQKAKA